MRLASVSIVAIVALTVLLPLPADAISQVEPTPWWYLKNFLKDTQEFITFDPTKKAQLKLQHAQELQAQIDILDSQGVEIPEELERRRLQKVGEAQNIVETSIQGAKIALQDAIDQIILVGELNEIRILHSQFANIIQNGTPQEQQDFQLRVNSLNTWQKHCLGMFYIDQFKEALSPWMMLKVKCPALAEWEQKHGIEGIKQKLGGY